jgi:ADP-ribosylation factor-like protein 2
MKECISELSEISNLSKILYLNTPHTDTEAYKIFGKVIQSLTTCFFEANKLHSTYNIGLAEILVLGSKEGGKTSIVNYLLHDKFIPQTNPTLTPQIFTLVYDNMDFRVLDVCCEEHIKQVLEDHPIEPGKLPQAIVYVVDVSLKGEKQKDSVEDFNEWIDYLYRQFPRNKFGAIPILILFNKIDLNPIFNEADYEKLYKLKLENLTYKYSTVSAITGKGLHNSFSWLVKRIKITEKF